jgi:antirestriction protein ArdC
MNTYEIITAAIVEKLAAGVIPWESGLLSGKCAAENITTGKQYRGLNRLLLAGGKSPFYCTFNQAKERGAILNTGSKGNKVVFYQPINSKNSKDYDEEKNSYRMLRYYHVFNVLDFTNIPAKWQEKIDNWNITRETAELSADYEYAASVYEYMQDRPSLEYCQGTPCFIPSLDCVRIPARESFKSDDFYFSVLFHELIHSTGIERRLKRYKNNEYSHIKYAKEELVAELGAAFLCAETGIDLLIENKTAYIASWLQALSNDPKMIVQASSKADKACNYILGKIEEQEKAE